jgi:hypothetical protein
LGQEAGCDESRFGIRIAGACARLGNPIGEKLAAAHASVRGEPRAPGRNLRREVGPLAAEAARLSNARERDASERQADGIAVGGISLGSFEGVDEGLEDAHVGDARKHVVDAKARAVAKPLVVELAERIRADRGPRGHRALDSFFASCDVPRAGAAAHELGVVAQPGDVLDPGASLFRARGMREIVVEELGGQCVGVGAGIRSDGGDDESGEDSERSLHDLLLVSEA